MRRRKVFTTIWVAALGVCLATAPQVAAAPVGSAQGPEDLSGVAVRYVKSRTPEEAQRILDQRSNGFQPYAIEEKYGPCTLYPRNVHVRTKTGDGDAEIIGFKPKTECSQPVESIKHESTLKYKYYAWWRDAPLKFGVPTRSGNRGVARLEQRNVEFHCNGLVDTTFIGHTVGTIVANGETFHAAVNTDVFRNRCRV
ncbi:hypothetical protein CAURIC_04555 [Corynebacterium auriscanis]|nr:hypothetical protein CAURIC_04555 [Corynebacterium auriscanis]